METNSQDRKRRGSFLGSYFAAFVCIVAGLLLLGKEAGIISYNTFDVLFSWQMLIIVCGVFTMLSRHVVNGLLVIAVGVYFLIPDHDLIYWAIVLIVAGIVFIFKANYRVGRRNMCRKQCCEFSSADGCIHFENSFGAIQHIVTDEVFKGGNIKNSFGSISLDLRRTTLGEGNNYLDIECNFGGIEIYAPAGWNIKAELHPFLGGCEDSRMTGVVIDGSRCLVLRGNLSFSGIEIKS